MATEAKMPAEVFGEQVRRTRKKKGWSQEKLAETLVRLGAGMHATAIAKIETGTRKVTLEESLQIAAALGVPPVHLVISLDDDQAMRLAPGGESYEPVVLRDWVRGFHPLVLPGDEYQPTEDFYFGQQPASDLAEAAGGSLVAYGDPRGHAFWKRLEAYEQDLNTLRIEMIRMRQAMSFDGDPPEPGTAAATDLEHHEHTAARTVAAARARGYRTFRERHPEHDDELYAEREGSED